MKALLAASILLGATALSGFSNTASTQASQCEPGYPDICIPQGIADLNCSDLAFAQIRVTGSDPHGLDRDRNGVACESNVRQTARFEPGQKVCVRFPSTQKGDRIVFQAGDRFGIFESGKNGAYTNIVQLRAPMNGDAISVSSNVGGSRLNLTTDCSKPSGRTNRANVSIKTKRPAISQSLL